MKFSCEKHILQAAVAVCARAAAAKSPIPTLEGVLLEAGERLRVTGYDLKKGIYTTVEADVSEPGSIVLDAKLFGEMVRRMPDGMVTISSDEDNKTTVKCGVVDGQVLDAAGVQALSELPPKEVLIAKMMGSLNAPITNFVGVLSATLRSLVYAIEAVRKQKGGEE